MNKQDCCWPGPEYWHVLPKDLQDSIRAMYEAGQEDVLISSRGYSQVAREVQDWIRKYELRKRIMG